MAYPSILRSQPHLVTVNNSVVHIAIPKRNRLFMVVKRGIQACFVFLALRRLICYWLARLAFGPRAFLSASESIASIPGLRGVLTRQAFYCRTLANCGQDVYFGWHSVFSMTEASVGDRVYIGRACSLGFAELGDETMLADGVQVLSGGREHARDDSAMSMQSQRQSYQRVRIGAGSWIGAGAIVMADVGEHSIVGAGAVVNKPIPAYSIAVGVPARVVKSGLQPSSERCH